MENILDDGTAKILTFIDCYEVINKELEKRRHKWALHCRPDIDYDDVKQIIFLHINTKFGQWDQSKSLLPWVNTVITNQTTNLLRNYFLNIAKPCSNCPANEGEDKCRIYGIQSSQCQLYAKWEKSRKNAYNVKLPVSIENHISENYDRPSQDINLEEMAESLHELMKKVLSPIQYKFYQALYIDHKSDEETATLMGYQTKEKNRAKGYKQLLNMKKIIIEKAKKVIAKYLY